MTGATIGLALRLDGVPADEAALPVAAARAAHARRRDRRERPAHLLRADERAAAPRDPRSQRQLLDQPAHRPRRAGAARLGRRPGRIAPRARSGWAWCCRRPTGAPRTCRACATWSTSSSRRCATRCRAPRRAGSTTRPTPGACSASPAGWRAPPSSPAPTTPCACAGSCSTRRPATARRSSAFLTRLAESGATLDRPRLKALLADGKAPGWDALSAAQRTLAGEVLRDLDLSLAEMPDESLGADFAYLAQAAARRPGAAGERGAGPAATSLRQRLLRSRRRADVPRVVGRDARRARAADRGLRGAARRDDGRSPRCRPRPRRRSARACAAAARRRRRCTSACTRRTSRAA